MQLLKTQLDSCKPEQAARLWHRALVLRTRRWWGKWLKRSREWRARPKLLQEPHRGKRPKRAQLRKQVRQQVRHQEQHQEQHQEHQEHQVQQVKPVQYLRRQLKLKQRLLQERDLTLLRCW